MNQNNLQNYGLLAIVGVIGIAFLAIVLGEVFGYAASETTRTFVFGLMSAIGAGAVTWLAATKTQDARQAAMYQSQRATIESQRAELAALKAQEK